MDNTSTGSPTSVHDRPWLNTSLSPDERTALLLAQMALEEKISMVHGVSNDTYSTAAISRLGIPALTMTDGPAGINVGQATSLIPSRSVRCPSRSTGSRRERSPAKGSSC